MTSRIMYAALPIHFTCIYNLWTHTPQCFFKRERECVCVFVVLRTETLLHMYVHTYIRSVHVYMYICMYVYVYVLLLIVCKPEATRDCVNTSSLQLCIIAGIFQNCLVYPTHAAACPVNRMHTPHAHAHTHTHTHEVCSQGQLKCGCGVHFSENRKNPNIHSVDSTHHK